MFNEGKCKSGLKGARMNDAGLNHHILEYCKGISRNFVRQNQFKVDELCGGFDG